MGSQTIADGRVCGIWSSELIENFPKGLESNRIAVDVLRFNAAAAGSAVPILRTETTGMWTDFETNVHSSFDLAKHLDHISSVAGYMWTTTAGDCQSYGLMKNPGTVLAQQMAKDTKLDDMQIASFHTGGALMDMACRQGLKESMGFSFDEEDLPGSLSVRTVTSMAEFLHGRPGEVAKRINEEPHFLQFGAQGLSECVGASILSQIEEWMKVLLLSVSPSCCAICCKDDARLRGGFT
ncbi:hypothetical protein LCI18_000589 [Fusarium solani-melongenae]|uniref:Uncharacterized protein n=1 Tax=Fusarium solani subsp. cucurbitae TaxID=2747967 RepID=A0ACD3YL30_FUSSC|nr:hypothetical protein LCI18_000589 [Fusarium solani-melongenae]